MSEDTIVHQEIISQSKFIDILEKHDEWVKSGYTKGERANFRGKIFLGHIFDRVCLKRADFRGARVNGCKFISCDLRKADFTGALLFANFFDNTDISGTNITGANFRHLSSPA